jgi:cellulose synthase/poly-beta-1,6-N-acetylglucosamine synthase-like glycosyltransferase
MNDVLIMVMTTEKYTDRQKAIKDTWFNDGDVLFYSDHKDEETYMVCVESDYSSGVIKQSRILKHIQDGLVVFKNKNAIDYKWILFADDDTYVNPKYLNDILNYFNEDCIYGHIWDHKYKYPEESWGWEDPFLLSGGAGMLVSTKNIKNIKDFSFPEGVWGGDQALTQIGRRNNIKFEQSNKFHPENIDKYSEEDANPNFNITYHWMKPKDFYSTYEKVVK